MWLSTSIYEALSAGLVLQGLTAVRAEAVSEVSLLQPGHEPALFLWAFGAVVLFVITQGVSPGGLLARKQGVQETDGTREAGSTMR